VNVPATGCVHVLAYSSQFLQQRSEMELLKYLGYLLQFCTGDPSSPTRLRVARLHSLARSQPSGYVRGIERPAQVRKTYHFPGLERNDRDRPRYIASETHVHETTSIFCTRGIFRRGPQADAHARGGAGTTNSICACISEGGYSGSKPRWYRPWRKGAWRMCMRLQATRSIMTASPTKCNSNKMQGPILFILFFTNTCRRAVKKAAHRYHHRTWRCMTGQRWSKLSTSKSCPC
jgi:hypothetical protein